MVDHAFVVLIAMMAMSFVFRMRMLAQLRRWTADQRARLFDAFYRQNKLTFMLWLTVIVLLLAPMLLGQPSRELSSVSLLLAVVIAIVGSLWSNRKLRRLDFPAPYVRLHAAQSAVLSVGVTIFALLLLSGS